MKTCTSFLPLTLLVGALLASGCVPESRYGPRYGDRYSYGGGSYQPAQRQTLTCESRGGNPNTAQPVGVGMSDLPGNSVMRRVVSMTPGARIGMAAGSGWTAAAGQFFLSRGKRESGPEAEGRVIVLKSR
jgi:hypothetical protein